jgi:threonine synthase
MSEFSTTSSSTSSATSSALIGLICGRCHAPHLFESVQTVCVQCGGPLLAEYDLQASLLDGLHGAAGLTRVLSRDPGPWRFPELLPMTAGAATPTLGEGATPLLLAPRLLPDHDFKNLWIKDEAQNPTGSFKARGMAVAIAKAVELGLDKFCLPSAGNAGGAAAAYGALHGVEVHVAIPRATPATIVSECQAHGAEVVLVDGNIADAGALQASKAAEKNWFNLATLREPYRLEGKKIMGYELLWDLGRLPDVVLYPTGGGTGLIGMLKAFDEMESLGWIGSERPRMVCVQTAGCAPMVRAFQAGAKHAIAWKDPDETAAFGLRVPAALGDSLILDGLRKTGGTAVAVSESELLRGTRRLAENAGVWGSPEGGACVAALHRLVEERWLGPNESIVLFNTGSALKYR